MVSARAGEEGTIEGLEAGADDYLVKPFAARELLARVRANLELDRARRTRDALRRSGDLLDQAQRLARVGSWEIDLATNEIDGLARSSCARSASTPRSCARGGLERVRSSACTPTTVDARARGDRRRGRASGPLDVEVRLRHARRAARACIRALGELERDEDGAPVRLRGSIQDITEQRAAEQALAAAAAEREAAARERRIADELQRSLLPERSFDAEHLEVGAYYRAGVEGTQVGGDWYDVIELGAGRTALVLGDVMGRGVRAAAVMGQLRAAVRAYAQLDLSPADVLEMPRRRRRRPRRRADRHLRRTPSSTRATARSPTPTPATCRRCSRRRASRRSGSTSRAGPPLGTGPPRSPRHAATLGRRLAARALHRRAGRAARPRDRRGHRPARRGARRARRARSATLPDALVHALVPDGTDDDVALLVARVLEAPPQTSATLRARRRPERDPPGARRSPPRRSRPGASPSACATTRC